MSRFLIGLLFLAVCTPVFAEKAEFADALKASLIFREDSNPKHPYGYPHVLLAYLHLENVHDSDVSWICDTGSDIEAELYDSKGKPVPEPLTVFGENIEAELYDSKGELVPEPPIYSSVIGSSGWMKLPHGSSMTWLLSVSGASMGGDRENCMALQLGRYGWLIPIKDLSSYKLKIRVKGIPWHGGKYKTLLLDLPATPIVLTKDSASV